ncbi:MAG TPA: type II secretion system protein GspE, partial [Methylomirabilota bacterium]|nr:type II secretion system protein GspE [Methylomirabilota bacterium]
MVISGSRRLLGEILVQEGHTTPDVVERALVRTQATGELLGEALVALGAVTAEDVLRAVAVQHGLPYLAPDELPSALPVLKNLSPKYLRQN